MMQMPTQEPVTFIRDCDAIIVPAGDTIEIPVGTHATITQAMGGSFTLFIAGNLIRIAGADADAIGKEEPEPIRLPENADDDDVEELAWAQMRTVFDPEIPIDIVDLGLVYRCEFDHDDPKARGVLIYMTLTAPGCGMGEILVDDVRARLLMVPTVKVVEVHLVFDPPWTMDMMSEEAKLQTGMI